MLIFNIQVLQYKQYKLVEAVNSDNYQAKNLNLIPQWMEINIYYVIM